MQGREEVFELKKGLQLSAEGQRLRPIVIAM